MKGLFIKDMKLMLGQIAFLIIIPVVGALIVGPTGQLDMGFGYITSVSGILAVTTINYDSYDNGYAFLFALPVSRRGYVKEKYVFALISSAVFVLVVGGFLWLLVTVVHPGNGGRFTEFAEGMWSSYMIVLSVLSLMIPVFLEFGAEKSRYIILIIFGVFMAVMAAVSIGETFSSFLDAGIKGVALLGLNAAFLAGSYAASCSIMENKDF